MRKWTYWFLPVSFIIGVASLYLLPLTQGGFIIVLTAITFILGYCFSWRIGLFSGICMFIGSLFPFIPEDLTYDAELFMQYGMAFIQIGLPLCIAGSIAPLLKRGFREPVAIAAMVVTLLVAAFIVYPLVPRSEQVYYISILASENTGDLDLYLPLVYDSGEPNTDLYDNANYRPPVPLFLGPVDLRDFDRAKQSYSAEVVETEYGKMLKLHLQELVTVKAMVGYETVDRYVGEICFGELKGVDIIMQEARLQPRYGEGDVPIKVDSGEMVEVKLTLINEYKQASRGYMLRDVGFRIGRVKETVTYDGIASDNWMLVPVRYQKW